MVTTNSNGFEIGDRSCKWASIRRVRYDNSLISVGLTLFDEFDQTYKIHVSQRDSKDMFWKELLTELVTSLAAQENLPRNYFDTARWRVIAKVFVGMALLIPVVLYLVGATPVKIFSSAAIWLSISLPIYSVSQMQKRRIL